VGEGRGGCTFPWTPPPPPFMGGSWGRESTRLLRRVVVRRAWVRKCIFLSLEVGGLVWEVQELDTIG